MSELVSANDVRSGDIIIQDGNPWEVLSREHVKPGKGPAYVQITMKSIQSNTKTSKRFKSTATIEKALIEETKYMYNNSVKDKMLLMDYVMFENYEFPLSLLGTQLPFLKEGMDVIVVTSNSEPISAKLPDKLPVVISSTESYIKGQTAASSKKPAILENGIKIMVPPFISDGETVIVDTRDMTYVERAKDGKNNTNN